MDIIIYLYCRDYFKLLVFVIFSRCYCIIIVVVGIIVFLILFGLFIFFKFICLLLFIIIGF